MNLHLVKKFFVDTLAKFTEHCRQLNDSIDVSIWQNGKESELMKLLENRVDTDLAMYMQGFKLIEMNDRPTER
jgi:hypothetical protein